MYTNCIVYCIAGGLDTRPSAATPTPSDTDQQGCFNLCDLTEGQGLFKILPTPLPGASQLTGLPIFQMRVNQFDDDVVGSTLESVQSEDGTKQATDHTQSGFSIRLSHGIQFQTGRLVWSLTALPRNQVLTIKMFSAARDGQLKDLRNIIDSAQWADRPMPHIFVTSPTSDQFQSSQYRFSTISIMTEDGIDVNTEYRPPTSDESCLYQNPSSALSPSPAASVPHPSPYLLLHIAVVNGDLDMVLYLLENGADVSPCLVVSNMS